MGRGPAGLELLRRSNPRLHFGLGDAGQVDEVLVRMPNGSELHLGPLSAGRIHVLGPEGEH